MKKPGKTVASALVVTALLAGLIGCQKKEGPAEKAGKEVDKVTEQVGQKIEKAGEDIKEAAKGDKK